MHHLLSSDLVNYYFGYLPIVDIQVFFQSEVLNRCLSLVML